MQRSFYYALTLIFCSLAFFISSCEQDDPDPNPIDPIVNTECGANLQIDWNSLTHDQTPYELNIPATLPNSMSIPADNPLTVKGVELGRRLFYDTILSSDSSQSCATCHAQGFGFTDNANVFSTGVQGNFGKRNAMALINLGWVNRFFWDGRVNTLEEQAIHPIIDLLEMHETSENVLCKLMRHPDYRQRFYEAFGTKEIEEIHLTKALAQFERTLISGSSKYDLALTPGSGVFLNELEMRGYELFVNETGDCFHCHTPAGNLFTDNQFHNNGMDTVVTLNDYPDKGLGAISGDPEDNGYFRTPTLRNIELTAPYMHDGRFQTLEEVVDHYSEHVYQAPNVDITVKVFFKDGGKHLAAEDKAALVAFLKTLTDTSFANNPAFQSPF